MKNRHVAAVTLSGALALCASIIAAAQNAAPAPETAAPAPRPGGGLVILSSRPWATS
jgi:hypothetical protein